MGSKYIGLIFDGCWKCVKVNCRRYMLRNLFNDYVIWVSYNSLVRLMNGETSVGKIWNRSNERGEKDY